MRGWWDEAKRHNARINQPPDENTQPTSQDARLMRGTLRAVGFNELLGAGLGECDLFINFSQRELTANGN